MTHDCTCTEGATGSLLHCNELASCSPLLRGQSQRIVGDHVHSSFKVIQLLYMRNKSRQKLARRYPPYKNRMPPAQEVSLCSESAGSHVLWSALLLHTSALSLSAVNSQCVGFRSLSVIMGNLVACTHLGHACVYVMSPSVCGFMI